MSRTQVEKAEFRTKIIREYSAHSSVDELGEHSSTMELYLLDVGDGNRFELDWDIPDLEEYVSIGIWTAMLRGKRTLIDYDGTFSLPKQAVALLRKAGIRVPKDFE